MKQTVLPVVRDVEILPAIIVIVASANALSPTRRAQAGFHRDVGESAIMIVAIEVIRRPLTRRKSFQRRAVDDENVRPAIVVVVEDGNPGSGRLNDVFLRVLAAEDNGRSQAGFLGDVDEIGDRVLRRLGLSLSDSRPTTQRNQECGDCPPRPA